jgi:hypothetical protein
VVHETSIDAVPDVRSPTARSTRQLISASDNLDPVRVQAQLDLAATVLGLGRCIDEIVIPVRRQLRMMVATGERDHLQELIATETIRSWLDRRGWSLPAPHPIGTVLLACGPRDCDMVGPESLALLLRGHRRPCWVLGARIPTRMLATAARAADTSAVVVFAHHRRGRPQAIASLEAVDALAIPVYYAGEAFDADRGRPDCPGRYLGTGLQQAAEMLMAATSPPNRAGSS